MPNIVIRIFIASSKELIEERNSIEILINRENKKLNSRGLFLETVNLEDFLESISKEGKPNDYKKAITQCDILLCLISQKVGKFTLEEFKTAYENFKSDGNPKHIFVYIKESAVSNATINNENSSVEKFNQFLERILHFPSKYKSVEDLQRQIKNQLEKILEECYEGKLISMPQQVAWQKISDNISLFSRGKDLLRTLCGKETSYDLSGNWLAEGNDIEVQEIGLKYSFKLLYTGKTTIKQHLNHLTIVGKTEALMDGKDSEVTNWDFTGTGIIHGEYVSVTYHQYSEGLPDTYGIFLLRIMPIGTLEGFFLAKRAIEDEMAKEKGFGFGLVTFKREKSKKKD